MTNIFFDKGQNIIYSLPNEQIGTYFLSIPKTLLPNFKTLIKLRKEDNARKGTSSTDNEYNVRKQLLFEVEQVNTLVRTLNSQYVYSKINKLPELPVEELKNCLDDSKPSNIDNYKEITKKIESKINEIYSLMVSSAIRKESIQQTLIEVAKYESDKDFIDWLINNLPKKNTNITIEALRTEYLQQKVSLNIEDFKEIIKKDGKKYIVGKNDNGELFTVEIPNNYNMNQLFEMEKKFINQSLLLGKDAKQVATILFSSMINRYQSTKMQDKENIIKREFKTDENVESSKDPNIQLNESKIDAQNNIIQTKDGQIMELSTENGYAEVNELDVNKYNYNHSTLSPEQSSTVIQESNQQVQEYEPMTQSKQSVKKRVLTSPNNPSHLAGYIKVGATILFCISFILLTASIVLLIIS